MEKIDIIDIDGNVTGEVETRKEVHKNGLLHHASGVIIFRKHGGGDDCYEILSQQRSFQKDKNAGLWDMSASGHIPTGETPKSSLIREIKEELGLDVNPNQLMLLGKFWRNEIYRKDFIENELDYIYILEKDVDIHKLQIQKEEVEDVQYISQSKFLKMIEKKEVVQRKEVWAALFEVFKHK